MCLLSCSFLSVFDLSFCSAVTRGSDGCEFWQSVGASHHTIAVLAWAKSNYIGCLWSLHVRAATLVVATAHFLINTGAWIRGDCTKASAVPASAAIPSLCALSFAWSKEATRSLVHIRMMSRIAWLGHGLWIC